jgi:uroporphyrinogen-III synthase
VILAKSHPILLLTRPERASLDTAQALRQMGARFDLIVSPLIGIEYVAALPAIPDDALLVFTSANGVRAYQALGGPPGRKGFAVGATTAETANAMGLDLICADGNAQDLIALITAIAPNQPLVHLHGEHSRGDLANRLRQKGFATGAHVLYHQPQVPFSDRAAQALMGSDPIIAPIYSPRTARIFAQHPVKAPLLVAALSEAVAKQARALHITELRIAPRPDRDLFLPLVVDLVKGAERYTD